MVACSQPPVSRRFFFLCLDFGAMRLMAIRYLGWELWAPLNARTLSVRVWGEPR